MVDVEFVTEALQLRYGHDDPHARCRKTEDALDALRAQGLLEEAHYHGLVDGYRFLRRVESRLRIERDQAVHSLEHEDSKLAPLARRIGYDGPDAGARLLGDVQVTRERIRRIYEHYFGPSGPQ